MLLSQISTQVYLHNFFDYVTCILLWTSQSDSSFFIISIIEKWWACISTKLLAKNCVLSEKKNWPELFSVTFLHKRAHATHIMSHTFGLAVTLYEEVKDFTKEKIYSAKPIYLPHLLFCQNICTLHLTY